MSGTLKNSAFDDPQTALRFAVPVRLGLSVGFNPWTQDRHRKLLLQLGADEVEAAATLDEALDILGNASRPVDVMVCWIGFNQDWVFRLLEILRKHEAPIAIHVVGRTFADRLAGLYGRRPSAFHGIGGFTGPVGEPLDVALEAMVDGGWTMRRILREGIVPTTMIRRHAQAIYGNPPGEPICWDVDQRAEEFRKRLRMLLSPTTP